MVPHGTAIEILAHIPYDGTMTRPDQDQNETARLTELRHLWVKASLEGMRGTADYIKAELPNTPVDRNSAECTEISGEIP